MVKNSVGNGAALQAKGIAAGIAATGEADRYAATRGALLVATSKVPNLCARTALNLSLACDRDQDLSCWLSGELKFSFLLQRKQELDHSPTLLGRAHDSNGLLELVSVTQCTGRFVE
eukprot:scaffold12839_cov119-Cylindrotheca_fusiformis.AAC.4